MENGAVAEGARSQWGFTCDYGASAAAYPSLLVQCLQSPAVIESSPGAEELILSESMKVSSSQVLKPEGQKQEEQKSETMQVSEVQATIGDSATRASDGSSVADVAAPAPADCCAAEEAAPRRDCSDPRAEGQPEQQVDANAEQPHESEEVTPQKPDFTGTWDLVRAEGDWDKFMSDMGLGWLSRNGAKVLRYGVGRVVLEYQQDGDYVVFSRVLCDPSKSGKANAYIAVGEGPVRFSGDLGYLACSALWEGSSLRYDTRLESSGLAMTFLTYFSDSGDLVEELRSYKGTLAKNIFSRRDIGGARRSSARRSGRRSSGIRISISSIPSAIRSSFSLRSRMNPS